MKTGQTPLEALQARKEQLRFDGYIQEDRIGAHIKYIQQHGTRLVLQSVASAILPGSSKAPNDPSKTSTRPSGLTDIAMGGISSLMKGNKGILPLIWNFAQPFILTWGIKGVKRLLFRKRR
ncbi:hypothetical protein [Parabacteroides sp. PF5-6]|uniref:hypothetical protein n=1 Tax=Parabacteroides sp. PF5-6 TaxID=1742403 RepID=UPI0024051148|nr:hypothetical protein [Parabacteroides sp. PF5-6]MDF9828857.1 hypothetical protein [Parabacteroides sp. PF5-6]